MLALLCALLLATSGRDPAACGPFLPVALITLTKHPDVPLRPFATGALGVLQPTYARSYLVVAYRHLAGKPLTDSEAEAIVGLWNHRLRLDEPRRPEDAADPPPTPDSGAQTKWQEARKAVPGMPEPPVITTDRQAPGPSNDYYPNLLDGAFSVATETLADRSRRFGAGSPVVREWVMAQDVIFSGEVEKARALKPLDASAKAPAIAQADRRYQIAAARFYIGDFDEARALFLKIADDRESPWRPYGRYLAARSLVRKASLLDLSAEERNAIEKKALAELQAVAADSTLPERLRASASGLAVLVRARMTAADADAQQRLASQLSAELMTPAANGEAFKASVDAFTGLLNTRDDSPEQYAMNADFAGKGKTPPSELIDWIAVMQGALDPLGDKETSAESLRAGGLQSALTVPRTASFARARERWRATKSVPWLVATLTNARTDADADKDLLNAAAQVPRESPAFATVSFHRARIMLSHGETAAARALLTSALESSSSAGSPSAANALRQLRRRTATTLDEFLADAAIPALGTMLDVVDNEIPDAEPDKTWPDAADRIKGMLLFDEDGASLMNHLPASDLTTAAERETWPVPVRRDVAAAAWVRAAITDQPDLAKRAAVVLRQLRPQLKADLDAYEKAASGTTAADRDARTIAVAWTLLRFPGLSVNVPAGIGRLRPLKEMDHWGDNWWCGSGQSMVNRPKPSLDAAAFPAFLSPDSRAVATHEIERMLQPAPNYLADATFRWAAQQPADPRVPQALHLVVEGTRWGCSDTETTQRSQKAHALLHSKYPKSPWTARTPYWFRGY